MSLRKPPQPVQFELPALQNHHGVPLGNGNLGVLLWGGDGTLKLTLNRQDYWQHQGILRWKEGATFKAVTDRIREGKVDQEVSEFMGLDDPTKPEPTRLPMGRFDLEIPAEICEAMLHVATGELDIGGAIKCVVLKDRPLCILKGAIGSVTPRPNNSDEVSQYRAKYGMTEPILFDQDGITGWVQLIDGQPAMCCAAYQKNDELFVTSVYGDTSEEAIANATKMLLSAPSYEVSTAAVAAFYRDWWNKVAFVQVPDRGAQIIYDLGMFKLSCATQPGSPAPTLQGPWVEDDRMPPWKSDYHFNINVQMAHWPMMAGNALEWAQPVVEMLRDWIPKMRDYAKLHMGIGDGIMLPHAVDDRCYSADQSWVNQFDSGSGGWTALMLWDLYRYGGDEAVLREVTWPMLRGTLRVYEEQIKWRGNVAYHVYGPSPEYHTDRPGWGENASFQLAIIHGLLRACKSAVGVLNIDEPRLAGWQKIARSLPKASVLNNRIALWEGQDLAESHRHHSHMAGIHPFDIFTEEDDKLIAATYLHWEGKGTGAWTGWCTAWATILWARTGDGNAAGAMLENYRRHFTGPNYFTRHNTFVHGFSTFHGGTHVMQLDGAMGAAAAILEMLAHECRGEIRLAPAVPDEWKDVAFEGIRLPGGKFASGVRENGVWTKLGVV